MLLQAIDFAVDVNVVDVVVAVVVALLVVVVLCCVWDKNMDLNTGLYLI